MTGIEIFYYALPIVLSFLAAMTAVVVFGLTLHTEKWWSLGFVRYIPAVLILALGLATAVSGRDASLYGIIDVSRSAGSGFSAWVGRLTTLPVVTLSFVVVCAAVMSRRSHSTDAKLVWYAFLVYYLLSHVVNGFLGTEFSLTYKMLYPIFVVGALYVNSNEDPESLIDITRTALLIFLIAGLLLLPVLPDLVRQKAYKGILPGISFRYWGLASHANNVGPLSVFLLMLMWWRPYRHAALNVLGVLVSIGSMLLAQSKTALTAGVAVFVVLCIRWLLRNLFATKTAQGGVLEGSAVRARSLIATFVLSCFGILALGVALSNVYVEPLDSVLWRLQNTSSLLTGREHIWHTSLEEWRNNIFFGYGPELWSDLYSYKQGLLGVASNSHNQAVEDLSAAGIFGLAGLIFYIVVLGRYAFRLDGASRGISVAIFVFILFRGFTEVPLKSVTLVSSDFFMQATMLAIFMRAKARLPNTPAT